MPKKSKTVIIEEFAEAAIQVIAKHPPENFKLPYFSLLLMSGRVEEATGYLQQFTSEPSNN